VKSLEINLIRAVKRGDRVAVKRLIGSGANVNGEDNQGWTPLFHAAHRGDVVLIQLLLHAGAEVNRGSGNGFTALFSAVLGGHLEVVRALLESGAKVFKVQGVELRGYARGPELKTIIELLEESVAKD
jgi:ankyrin repeat protein